MAETPGGLLTAEQRLALLEERYGQLLGLLDLQGEWVREVVGLLLDLAPVLDGEAFSAFLARVQQVEQQRRAIVGSEGAESGR